MEAIESFIRSKLDFPFRILCKFHLLYDSKFLTDYFDTITRQEEESERCKIEIENVANSSGEEEQQQQQSSRQPQRSSFRWKLAFMSHFLIFRMLHQSALWIFDSQITARMQVLLINAIALDNLDSNMQIFFILYLVLSRNILHLIYVRNRGLTFRVLREAIVENGNSFFLEPRFRFSNWIVRILAGPNDLISKQLHSFGVWLSNIAGVIFYLIYLHVLYLAIVQLFAHHFSPLDYAILCVNLTLNLSAIYLVFHILAIMAINGILVTIVAYVKLKQIEHFVRRHFRHKLFDSGNIVSGFPAAEFQRFRAVIVTSMYYLADANRIYGKAFFDALLTNVPLNSLIIGMLLTGQFSGSIRLIAIGIIVVQIFILIVMHIGAAVLTRRMHRPVKYFFRYIADPEMRVRGAFWKQAAVVWHRNALGQKRDQENFDKNKNIKKSKIFKMLNGHRQQQQQPQPQRQQQISLRLRLQIARYIGDFHTNKQYSVNYGKYGPITFAAIKKQIFINIKLIIFSYMLYQSKK